MERQIQLHIYIQESKKVSFFDAEKLVQITPTERRRILHFNQNTKSSHSAVTEVNLFKQDQNYIFQLAENNSGIPIVANQSQTIIFFQKIRICRLFLFIVIRI